MGESKRVKKKQKHEEGQDSLEKIGWDGKDLNILRGNKGREKKMRENTMSLNVGAVIIAMYFCLLIIFSMIASAHLIQLAIVLAVDFVIVIMLSFLIDKDEKAGNKSNLLKKWIRAVEKNSNWKEYE